MKTKFHATTAVIALSTAGWAMPAAAQSTPAPAADAVASVDDQAGLSDIVVTAQRESQTAQKSGIAIDVVSTKELSNAGINTSETLNAAVPSLYISKGGGVNTSYFIRGVGNFTNNGYSDPAVAFNVDGVYLGRPGSTVGTFYDLERIEVLKGPQGTLYGRNATGGAINVITAKPVVGELSGRVTASYGNYNAFNAEAYVNVPMGPDGALRISGNIVDRNGFNKDGTSDEVGHAIRVQMLANLTPTLTVRVSGDYAHNGGKGIGGSYSTAITRNTTAAPTPIAGPPGTGPAINPLDYYSFTPSGLDPRSGLLSPEGRAYFSTKVLGGAFIFPAPLNTPYQNNDFINASAEVNWQTGIGTFTFIPAFRDSRINTLYNGPSFRGGLVSEHDSQFSAELRLAGKSIGPVDWLIGGFFFDETIKGRQTISQYVVQSYQPYVSNTKSYAAFGRLTFNLTDRFRLIGAARYTKDKKTFDGSGQNLIEICGNAPPPTGPGCFGGPSVPVATSLADLGTMITIPTLPGPPNSVAYGTFGNRLFFVPVPILGRVLDRNRFTYRGAVEFDLGPRSLLYASYETGYRSGGFNFSLGRETYEPEFIKAATIGIKNRFFDNRLQLNIEAFRWDYTNQQVAHFGLDATGGNSYFTENIGKSRIQGVDVDFQFKATPTTLLRGSVQILDNKLTDFKYNTIRNTAANNVPPQTGCPASQGFATLPGSTTQAPVWIVDCSGRNGYNSPKLALNGGIEQTIPVGSFDIVLTADGRYRSNRSTSFEFLPLQESGSDFIADASLRISPRDGKWSATAFVQNLTDQTVPTVSNFAGTTGNVVVTNYSPPRTYGIRLSAGF